MPKLYLGPGLSNRVHQALRRRLERFMAANAEASGHAGAPDLPMAENPPLSVNLHGTETEGDKGDDQVSQPPPPGDVATQRADVTLFLAYFKKKLRAASSRSFLLVRLLPGSPRVSSPLALRRVWKLPVRKLLS